MITVAPDDPLAPDVAALLAHHLAEARGSTPAANAHAIDGAGLCDPAITFWTARDDGALAGFVALNPHHGEVKSMRAAPSMVGRGVGRALLDHLLVEARARRYVRVSLETGTAPMFAPANRLYERAGFVDAAAFGGYPPSPHNRFMTLTL